MGFTWTEQMLNGRTGCLSLDEQVYVANNSCITKSHLTKRCDIAQHRLRALWALPWTENSSGNDKAGTEQAVDYTLMSNQAGHLSKIFRFPVNLASAETISKVPIQLFFPQKTKKRRKKKILDKLNKAICSVDQSQPVRFACRWAHAIRAIHWLARQPVAMATWRWRRAEWGVVGGIKWRRERMLPPTPYYSDLV